MKPEFTLQAINEYQPFLLDHLKSLLTIPSMYDESTTGKNKPFGQGIHEALEFMLALGESEGFNIKNVDGYAGHIEWGQGTDLIGVLGHLDVVPPGEGWSGDPFRPIISDGKLFARGAQDDKGPVMAAFIALKWLKDLGVQPNKRVRFIVGTDEERQWKCMKHYFEQEEMPSLGFSPDAKFPVIHAEKGLVDVELTKSTTMKQPEEVKASVLSLRGGERLNMVPEKATVTLSWNSAALPELFESFLKEDACEGEIIQQPSHWEITMKGKSAHAMEPNNGVNAFVSMVRFLQTIPIAEELKQDLKWISETLAPTRGERIGIACQDDVSGPLTVNIGQGSIENDKITLGLNMRYPVTEDFDKLFAIFKEEANSQGFEETIIEHLESIFLEKDHPFVQQLLNVYKKHTPNQENVAPIAIGGATYARALEQGVAYGALFDDSPDTAHNADEHVRIDDLMKAALIYAEALYDLVTD
ncbi:dipeptidase PepV [Pontibacillus yanchengensis]|uniref:Dipeptidase PepV n=1 Tax=Pontibacillus yanchengensis Y32 TaxID=1385514 RepID=A0A0A2T9X3_9BACI|nr:dipeptidase PepV [Pontibacillus yanchengensis]KGP71218.1 dipeptidase PepV [Pontibacillus yanchengensis Y32]